MKIGIVGYQSSGKSTLFSWLSGTAADRSLAHSGQTAAVEVIDPRVARLVEIYRPKKITHANLQLVDTPGLEKGSSSNAGHLSLIREAGCLVHVVGAYSGDDPLAQLVSFDEDLLLADLEIIARRVEKLTESVKKPQAQPRGRAGGTRSTRPGACAARGGQTAGRHGAFTAATEGNPFVSASDRKATVCRVQSR